MNSIFSRTLKTLCTIAVVGVLVACGASSTVDPFKPTRVIGLGDGYNDSNRTLAPTVADQVATNFGLGLSSVVNLGSTTGTISSLSGQIGQVTGGFTAGDLVVISVGAIDIKNTATTPNPTAISQVPELVSQIQWLLVHNVKHVLVMPTLDVSRTPWGATHTTESTAEFNGKILMQVGDSFGGRSPNPVIYADVGLSPISSQFLSMTASTPFWYSPFNCFDFHSGTCSGSSTVSTSLFNTATSDIYLTSAGNQWLGNLLYNATAQGWR